MKILIATNNKGKQKEFARILGDLDLELVFPADVGLSDLDVDETGSTAKENAYLKAVAFAEKTGILTVADDSGLEIDALDGAPGIHSKRFHIGEDTDRNQRIFELMDGIEGPEKRKALFRSVLCLYDPKTKQTDYFEGLFYGYISREEKGTDGFGFDPIFIPVGETRSIAELGIDYKNEHSHRALAIKKLMTFLENL
ncbi:MAG: RdgB/HAM1 family non-canonical purine NTP pyrophosphatase [Candidatus Pacebacteria bacterium]|nr:RdgB/HAM1 family non-canonical purine NTP pyrophosphatase [Candidatus Paceibacterota bacterium]